MIVEDSQMRKGIVIKNIIGITGESKISIQILSIYQIIFLSDNGKTGYVEEYSYIGRYVLKYLEQKGYDLYN